jgi:hypothetical protein
MTAVLPGHDAHGGMVAINTVNSAKVAAMDFNDGRDDLADDDDDVAIHRARARDLLPEISRQAKEGLSQRGINHLDLFFVIPSDSIITFGTTLDPDDAEWAVVGEVVSGVVQRLLGLTGTRRRSVVCATTDTKAGRQPSPSTVQPSEPSGCYPASMPAPALQAGAEQ